VLPPPSPVTRGEVEAHAARRDHSRVEFTSRPATLEDLPRLIAVMDAAISELQRRFLGDDQIEASRAVMGLDTQLIEDGTYFVIEVPDGDIAGCGGWSRRATMYGNDHSPGRDTRLLDPHMEAAKVRAMYTNPKYARRGVGRLVLSLCERAAAAEGFTRLELVGTLAGGAALYRLRFCTNRTHRSLRERRLGTGGADGEGG
jgi:GNAT superfamily N-acetyltransferase